MKSQILLLILFCNLASYGQTKKETIDWLNSKFETSPIMVSEIQQYTRFLKIKQDGSFTILENNYSPKVLLPDTTNYRWKTLFTGNFKDLSPNSVRTETIKGKVFFYASCRSGKCITQKDQGPDYDTFTNSEVTLGITSDASLEARCKKAFIHLITLCGGKKEPF
jgi:hypothetical protein